jgi:hypothetical protein
MLAVAHFIPKESIMTAAHLPERSGGPTRHGGPPQRHGGAAQANACLIGNEHPLVCR